MKNDEEKVILTHFESHKFNFNRESKGFWQRILLLIFVSYSIGSSCYIGFLIYYFDQLKTHLEAVCQSQPASSRNNGGGICPSGWSNSSSFGACYIIIYDVDYELANRFCHYMDSQMVQVDGEAKNNFLIKMIKDEEFKKYASGNLLLGGRRMNNRFYWKDGGEFEYTNWASREPTTGNGKENCLLLVTDPKEILSDKYARWRTVGCESTQKFSICEWKYPEELLIT